jgi:Na+/H+ antiporter NhaD/arsenite permease-like protein
MKRHTLKLATLAVIAGLVGVAGRLIGMTEQQCLAVSIFSASILGTLFFWDFRLSFAFIGTAVLLITKTIDLEHVLEFSSLEVILFLVGMMVIIGFMKDAGLFAWLVSLIVRVPHLSGIRFVVLISVAAALLACAVDEVTSIIFIAAAVLEVCAFFNVNPLPFIIIAVLATNIGSAATVLGNPIGILIASKSGLSFEDFVVKAMPLAMLCLVATIGILLVWYRKAIAELDTRIKARGAMAAAAARPVALTRELKIGLFVFLTMFVFIALHRRLEVRWDLAPNTVLLVVPLITSGLVMIWKSGAARKYIEHDVEWWTLLFFLLLFVQAGTLKYTGSTVFLARKLAAVAAQDPHLLTGILLWMSAAGSSVLDNVVLVAALIPVVQGFQALHMNVEALWWALLFGGCMGGNITLIGSTANIVAIGILEKERNLRVSFMDWFGVGLTVGVVTTLIVWLALTWLPLYQ